jgi:hypothetical protein
MFKQMDITHNNITGLIPSNYGQNFDPDLDISFVDFSNKMLTSILKLLRCLEMSRLSLLLWQFISLNYFDANTRSDKWVCFDSWGGHFHFIPNHLK